LHFIKSFSIPCSSFVACLIHDDNQYFQVTVLFLIFVFFVVLVAWPYLHFLHTAVSNVCDLYQVLQNFVRMILCWGSAIADSLRQKNIFFNITEYLKIWTFKIKVSKYHICPNKCMHFLPKFLQNKLTIHYILGI
jgi:uncharacterized membrane protein